MYVIFLIFFVFVVLVLIFKKIIFNNRKYIFYGFNVERIIWCNVGFFLNEVVFLVSCLIVVYYVFIMFVEKFSVFVNWRIFL